MAVYERRYRPYQGPETPTWSRFLIPARYGFQRLVDSKALLFFLVLCSFYPIGCLVYVYVVNNLSKLAALGISVSGGDTTIGPDFFLILFEVQATVLGMILTLIVGPGVISPDLANNGLPLYLVRPFSRWEYVAGKLMVVVSMLSLVILLPPLAVFGMQSVMSPSWGLSHLGLLLGVVIAALLQCLVYALLATAVSATVRWRPVAAAILFVILTLGGPLGLAIGATLQTRFGTLLDVQHVLRTVRKALIGGTVPINEALGKLPIEGCIVMLLLLTGLCLWQLKRRLEAYEVVR